MRPELKSRITFGVLMALLLVAGVWWDLHHQGHGALCGLAVLAAALGCREFTRLARTFAAEVQFTPMLVVSLLVVAEALLHQRIAGDGWFARLAEHGVGLPLVPLLLGAGLLWSAVRQMFRHATERFFANVGSTLMGMIYIGVSLNLVLRMAMMGSEADEHRGIVLFILFLAAVKCGDIGAYFGGRAFGRHKMAPRISPGKTWEGFAFSFAGALAGVYALRVLLTLPSCGLVDPFDAAWKPALWAVVLAPLGVLGDLAESSMKRDASVKDSGRVIPGFGGFLDVLDAVLIAAPVAYILALAL
jgi:phosphatidate cytidylyltransferase